MSHPFNEHRQSRVEKSRVSHLVKGYKSGGAVKSGNVTHGAKANREMARMEMEAEGSKASHRMDRPARAKGGRVKKGNAKTIVNVITGGHPAGGAVPPMSSPPPMGIAGPPPGAMPPPMAAKPPMMPPPGAGPGGPPPMMRAKGGRVRRADGGVTETSGTLSARKEDIAATRRRDNVDNVAPNSSARKSDWPQRASGGRVQTPTGTGVAADTGVGSNTGTAVFNASRKSGTHTSHSDGKSDGKDIGRGRVVTFATGGGVRSFRAYGGRVESPDGVAAATKLPGGSGGGEARLAKEHRAERKR